MPATPSGRSIARAACSVSNAALRRRYADAVGSELTTADDYTADGPRPAGDVLGTALRAWARRRAVHRRAVRRRAARPALLRQRLQPDRHRRRRRAGLAVFSNEVTDLRRSEDAARQRQAELTHVLRLLDDGRDGGRPGARDQPAAGGDRQLRAAAARRRLRADPASRRRGAAGARQHRRRGAARRRGHPPPAPAGAQGAAAPRGGRRQRADRRGGAPGRARRPRQARRRASRTFRAALPRCSATPSRSSRWC